MRWTDIVATPLFTVVLLIASNMFMTVAWYGHLKHREYSLGFAIFISWMIALPEYALHVPANRYGYGNFTGFQLKIMQEAITLVVFTAFAYWYLGEALRWNYVIAFGFLFCAVVAAFWK